MKTNNRTFIIAFIVVLLVSQIAFGDFIVTTGDNVSVNGTGEAIATGQDSDLFDIIPYDIRKDFSVSSNNRIMNICACSVFSDKLTITNLGNVEETYSISSDRDYTRFTSQYVALQPGDSFQFYNYVKPGCREVDEDMTITVESGSGIIKELVQKVNSGFCDNINVAPINTLINTTPCTLEIAKFKLKNPLDFSENYYFDTSILKDYATFSENPAYLAQGEEKDILVYYNPDCGIYGEFEGEIRISTENTELEAVVPLLIDIERKYNYTVEVPYNSLACNYLETKIPITITNQENFTNTYSLSTDKEGRWFSLDNKSVEVEPLGSKTVYLDAHPRWDIASPVEFSLVVVSELGEIEKTAYFIVNVSECYQSELSYVSNYHICSDDDKIYFNLKNTGSLNNVKFTLNHTGGNILEMPQKEVILDSGENITFSVAINVSDTKKSYSQEIIASAYYNTFTEELPFKLSVETLHDCYKADIDAPRWVKSRYAFGTVNLTITNKGFKNTSYNVLLESEPLASIYDNWLILGPGEQEAIPMYIDPDSNATEGRYKGKIIVVDQSSNSTYEKKFVINLVNRTLWEKIQDFFKREEKNETVVEEITCSDIFNESQCKSNYHINMAKNKDKSIKLSKYATEPDRENMTFEVQNISGNLSYVIEGEIITLIPAQNFTGFQTFYVTATDPHNASATSPMFIVEVKEFSIIAFLQIVLMFLILLAVLVYIVARVELIHKEREDKKKLIVRQAKSRRRRKR